MGVTKILLTNRNHSRAANVVRTRTGAKTFIHPDDAAHARSQGAEIDGELNVGERIGPLTIVAVPGKSPGEVALHWPERRLLIVGDAVIGNPPGQCGLLREKVMDDPARLKAKRTQAPRSGIRHAALRRRGVDPPRCQSAVEGAGRHLSGRVKPAPSGGHTNSQRLKGCECPPCSANSGGTAMAAHPTQCGWSRSHAWIGRLRVLLPPRIKKGAATVADRKPFDRDRCLRGAASWQDVKFGAPSILLCGRNNWARSCYARA